MKTSNVLLILLFVISISLTSAVPVMVNLKLKHRDFTDVRERDRYTLTKFGGAKFISLKGLGNCVIVPSDSLMLEAEISLGKQVQTDQNGDTLIIRNDSAIGLTGLPGPNFKLYVPAIGHIYCTDSNIDLRGSINPEQARSYRVDLFNSKLVIRARASGLAPYRQFFDQLFVIGSDDCRIDFSSDVTIRSLNLVNIKNTIIDGSSVAIDEISTTYDPKAIVKMKSLHGALEINAIP